ncbi:MAG: hypothetical protein LBL53_02240 [Endomicrobium sp.]|jgi:biotin carboxyl carrier protein|nr:hypothetical protein [Endomicrobium sp.]
MSSSLKNITKTFYNMMLHSNVQELKINLNTYKLHIKRKVKTEIKNNDLENKCSHVVPYIKDTVNLETIKSPIVGIFYRAPTPLSPPFVNVGDIVESNTVICLIEAMKVINEIKTPYKLKVIKILIDNGQPVAMSQGLFKVEKVK